MRNRDQWRTSALSVADALPIGTETHTSELIVAEILDAFAGSGQAGRAQAVRMVHQMETRGLVIHPLPEDWLHQAMERYESRPDKSCGLTDCWSFILMESLGIHEALTADGDFRAAGFAALLLDAAGR